MATACMKALPEGTEREILVVTNYENDRKIEGAQTFAAGHPEPDENGLKAGEAIIECLKSAGKTDRVIVLISGGGSALVPAPIDGISLEDKIAVNKLLLDNGYAIGEMNLIRQTLSRLKGGGMSLLAHPAKVQAYILSDVVGDDLSVIASGPTNPPLGTTKDALELFASKDLVASLPDTVRKALNAQRQRKTEICPTRRTS